ncbi:hypothetical protein K8612_16575 [Corallococcus sp. AS-1-6]|nr:hypothetical protein [Corallococcus sp. AS-1-6]
MPKLPTELGFVAERWGRLLDSVAPDERPLIGGFSGGPVFLLGAKGETVLGLLKEGGPRFEDHVGGWLSPWDDVLSQMRMRFLVE